ncbi:hypothetical protein Btru_026599 [Bulinus truncatus]|nr:hypothetical protein Btru_026599 [Bulinus truncatus]
MPKTAIKKTLESVLSGSMMEDEWTTAFIWTLLQTKFQLPMKCLCSIRRLSCVPEKKIIRKTSGAMNGIYPGLQDGAGNLIGDNGRSRRHPSGCRGSHSGAMRAVLRTNRSNNKICTDRRSVQAWSRLNRTSLFFFSGRLGYIFAYTCPQPDKATSYRSARESRLALNSAGQLLMIMATTKGGGGEVTTLTSGLVFKN